MPAKKRTEEELHQKRLTEIREHIERLGITEQDIADALKWARETDGKDADPEAAASDAPQD
jgi:hypothetical protein